MKRTKAVSSRPMFDEPVRPSPLIGKTLDKRDRLSWAMEFWRRRKPTLGRRCDAAGEDRDGCGGGLGPGDRGGACSCHEHVQLGFGAEIFSRAIDLANTLSETASTSARTKSAQRSRPLDKHHPGLPKIARTQDSVWATESREGQVRGPDVQHAVAADEGLSTLGRRSTSRGRAAHQMIRRPPRGPGSATIDHHLQAFAAERQGVRHAVTGVQSCNRRDSLLP
jgi:hypothetical protein